LIRITIFIIFTSLTIAKYSCFTLNTNTMARKHFLWLCGIFIPLSGICQADQTQNLDPFGFGMSIIAMTVVFVVLILLYLSFKFIAVFFLNTEKRKAKKELYSMNCRAPNAEEAAAIAVALHLYMKEQRDQEDMKQTITMVSKNYSPWSSKIYGIGFLQKH